MSTDDREVPKDRLELTEEEKVAAFEKIKAALAKSSATRELPSIKQIVKLAKRAVSSAVNLDTKSRRIVYAIRRIEYIKETTRAEFDRRREAEAIDDPEVYYKYLEEADRAIGALSLQIEKLGISATESKTTPSTTMVKPTGKTKAIPAVVPKAVADPINDGFIDKNLAAAYLGISLRALGYRMKEPTFPIHRHNGRRPLFKKSELDAWVAQKDK